MIDHESELKQIIIIKILFDECKKKLLNKPDFIHFNIKIIYS